MTKYITGILIAFAAVGAHAQNNPINTIRHDAPQLAEFGDHAIGVRTLQFTDKNRPDILNTAVGGETQYYDRSLTVEIWYPARLSNGKKPGVQYRTVTRNPAITATLSGTAVRNADALSGNGAYPLVIISHGYPGNRYLLSHLGENLASKGYVVASIDHADSTYDDQQAFASTLYNRPLDQLFVLNQMAALSMNSGSFLGGLVDADNTGIVGYSMGGYGLVNNLGGGYNEQVIGAEMAPPNNLLHRHTSANPDYRANLDPRIKAGFAVAPWGMTVGMWRPQDLKGINVPTFYLAGSIDVVAGYENGVRAIFEHASNSDRYLLTYENAGHNAGAPIPLPAEIRNSADKTGASHYTDPVWDSVRMNNIMDHFATAYFGYYLKGDKSNLSYLDLVPHSNDGVHSMSEEGPSAEHTYWKGFDQGTARGLRLEHLTPE